MLTKKSQSVSSFGKPMATVVLHFCFWLTKVKFADVGQDSVCQGIRSFSPHHGSKTLLFVLPLLSRRLE